MLAICFAGNGSSHEAFGFQTRAVIIMSVNMHLPMIYSTFAHSDLPFITHSLFVMNKILEESCLIADNKCP